MPTVHCESRKWLRQCKLQPAADGSYHYFSPSNNKGQVLAGNKDTNPSPPPPLWVPPTCLSVSMETSTAAATTIANASATKSRGKTLHTLKRLREEQQRANKTARKNKYRKHVIVLKGVQITSSTEERAIHMGQRSKITSVL